MSVWEVNSPSKCSGSPVSHADQMARSASTYSRMRAAGRVHGTPIAALDVRADLGPSPSVKRPPLRSWRFQAV